MFLSIKTKKGKKNSATQNFQFWGLHQKENIQIWSSRKKSLATPGANPEKKFSL